MTVPFNKFDNPLIRHDLHFEIFLFITLGKDCITSRLSNSIDKKTNKKKTTTT